MLASEPRTHKHFGVVYAFLCTRESLDNGATLFWVDFQQKSLQHRDSPTDVLKHLFLRKDPGDVDICQQKEIIEVEELHTIPSKLGVRKIDFIFELDSSVKSPASLITHLENVLARNVVCTIADDGTTQFNAETWAKSVTIAHPTYVSAPQVDSHIGHGWIEDRKTQRFEVCNDIVESPPKHVRKNGTTYMTPEEIDAYARGNTVAVSGEESSRDSREIVG